MDISRLGKRIGDYPAGNIGALLTQLLRRFVLGFFAAAAILGVVDSGIAALDQSVPIGIVVLGPLFGVHRAWCAVSARYGIRRYYLHEHGVCETDLFGRLSDAMAWDDVTGLREISGQSPLYNFYRLELHRLGLNPMALITVGFKRTLIDAVLEQLQRAGSTTSPTRLSPDW